MGARPVTIVRPEEVEYNGQVFTRSHMTLRTVKTFANVVNGATSAWELPRPKHTWLLFLAAWADSADGMQDVTTDMLINNDQLWDTGHPLSSAKPSNSLVGVPVGAALEYKEKIEGTLTNDSGGDLDDIKIFGAFEILVPKK